MGIRETKDVLEDIQDLVKKKGYIYVLCLIIVDDFHFFIGKMHQIDNWSRLSKNEVSLLFGFLIQQNISLEMPENQFDLIDLKKKTYILMEELHSSTLNPMIKKYKPMIENPDSLPKISKHDFFGGENMFIEPIFYAGDGLYDFQYLEFLDRKYKYDEKWLSTNKNFDFKHTEIIVNQIKDIHRRKIQKINFLELRERKPQIIRDIKKSKRIPKNEKNKNVDEFLSILEFYQYYELFDTDLHIENGLNPTEIGKEGWKSFYNGLIDLFTICRSDFCEELNIESFLDNFSTPIYTNDKDRNCQFKNIGDFNLFVSKPILKLDSTKFFVPLSSLVYESVYESPYYWMLTDDQYKVKLAENRGKVGEEITYELLVKVFGTDRVFKSVKIKSKKGHDDTDIDVLCVLGSKALCVQVKSKKLTQLSRQGNFNKLKTDFKAAVQDAYNQGLICHDRILERNAKFIDEDNNPISLSEDIDEVYILGVTTENYPTLTHQVFAFLEKDEATPYPLFLTIFDLELVLYYLDNPYDFLYYIRQRIDLMDYIYSNEEINYLGYHLIHKLWKKPEASFIQIDVSLGQLINQNYYPLKLGLKVSTENDKIGNRWKNEDFNTLCNQIAEIRSPKKTDIIFHLLDWSQESRDNLINQIKVTKEKTHNDGEWHNFSIVAGFERSSFGLTFISWNDNNIQELNKILLRLSKLRKYKSHADLWIGIGCILDSGRIVDSIVYSDAKWVNDLNLEEESKIYLEGKNKGTHMSFGKEAGRNDFCPCGSGKKYKKCCGRKF